LSTSKKALGDAPGGGPGWPRLGVRTNLRSIHGDVAAASAGLFATRRRSLALGSVLAASLAGCALGPDFVTPAPPAVVGYLPPIGPSRPADLISGQSLVEGGDISGHWWETFRSPRLNDLIACGIEHNPNLQAAEAAVRMAQATAAVQEGALSPTAD
jgi:hypothetical protein